MANSHSGEENCKKIVVNCFQISNFVLWQTAVILMKWILKELWIAFKLVILSYGKQQRQKFYLSRHVVNCFQISNFVLWQTAIADASIHFKTLWIAFKLVILSYGKQQKRLENGVFIVVNCFQISNFVLWQTALLNSSLVESSLWIAFKLVILSYGKQPTIIGIFWLIVVNCFQISNFVLWQTASAEGEATIDALWIAFKLVILSYGKQHSFIAHII